MTTAPLGRSDGYPGWTSVAQGVWSRVRADWSAAAFAAIAIVAALFGFVAFQASQYWTDEFFTLFVIDHDGGSGEVLRRALTDTHPPSYYLLLHAWTRVFGVGEWATRLPSALCAVGALGVTGWALRGLVPKASIAFALAVGATSTLWFFQAQNARSYALCLLLSAMLIALAVGVRAKVRDGAAPSDRDIAVLAGVGLLAAFTHFYMLLAVGMVFGFLILTTPAWRFRYGLAGAGLAILMLDYAYMGALLGETEQNVHAMWFRNDPTHLLWAVQGAFRQGVGHNAQIAVGALAAIALLGPLVAPAPRAEGAETDDRRWLVALAVFTLGGVYLAGVAVSLLFAPSISDQNLLTAAPFAWVLLAALHRRAFAQVRPGLRSALAAALIALVGSQLLLLGGRFEQRNPAWKAAGDYIAALPACEAATIPVVRPYRFGPDTPFFRTLAREQFFGRNYAGSAEWLLVKSPRAFITPEADPAFAAMLAERARSPSACPVLAWAVHDVGVVQARSLQQGLERLPALRGVEVKLRMFGHKRRSGLEWAERPSAFVLEVVRPSLAIQEGR